MPFEFNNQYVAYTLARLILGILLLMQGYDKIFKIRLRNVVQAYELPMNYSFSEFWIWTGTIFTSYTELICGPLLMFGLFTDYALCLVAIDLLIVVIALGTQNPMWDMKYVFPRLVLTLFLLATPATWNFYALDQYFFIK